MDYPKLANCSFEDLVQACKKLEGCAFAKAGKHVIKITHIASQAATVIPSSKPLKKGLVWDFVRTFLQGKCGFTEKEIFDVLWC
ncbi:MAG TPA: hypothetical protein VMT81_01150 [Candidatus Paceibacterota bacterium]|nr:hypothetical protein [Candidatus Paceibacterota bacterium]